LQRQQCADLAKHTRFLEHDDIATGLPQRHRRGEARDVSTDDGDAKYLIFYFATSLSLEMIEDRLGGNVELKFQ
jgi:hypothetical protein